MWVPLSCCSKDPPTYNPTSNDTTVSPPSVCPYEVPTSLSQSGDLYKQVRSNYLPLPHLQPELKWYNCHPTPSLSIWGPHLSQSVWWPLQTGEVQPPPTPPPTPRAQTIQLSPHPQSVHMRSPPLSDSLVIYTNRWGPATSHLLKSISIFQDISVIFLLCGLIHWMT